MNLSCSACSQSASVNVSLTPPGAEQELLIIRSIAPSFLCAVSTKFLASASLVRSAGMATTVTPVALLISSAVFSSGSMRRAQMATLTPSFASVMAMPLPIPSLPPVMRAHLPLSCRSMISSFWVGGEEIERSVVSAPGKARGPLLGEGQSAFGVVGAGIGIGVEAFGLGHQFGIVRGQRAD